MEHNPSLSMKSTINLPFTSQQRLRIAIHLIGVFPLLELAFRALTNQLTFNPIQFVEQFLGRVAINLLVATLAVTPLITLTGWKAIHRHRRTLGLYTFFYFSLHLSTFVALDYGFNVRLIFQFAIQKPFIIIGAIAGLLLLALAVTSYKFSMKKLGKNWKRLHRSIYLIAILAVLHYALAVKGSLTTLSGNIVRPLVMGGLILLLLVLRVPPVRRGILSLRQKLSTKS
jgi:sulfoxide reductase heme-binding subunit YedZ